MEGNSWERLIRTERNGQSAIVGIEGENHDSSLSSDDVGIGAREERVRCVLSELRHLASIRSQCETALRQLPSRSNERERMRNRVLHIDSTLNLVMAVVEALDDCEPGLGSIFYRQPDMREDRRALGRVQEDRHQEEKPYRRVDSVR